MPYIDGNYFPDLVPEQEASDLNQASVKATQPSDTSDVPRYQTWPERAVRGAIQALALPGDVLSGKVQPNSPQEIERAVDLAGLMVGGPAPVASKMADGTLGSFAGVRSLKIDREALADAQLMEKQGVHADDIWNQTGFMKDPSDNRWKYEISNQNDKLNPEFFNKEPYVSQPLADGQVPYSPNEGKITGKLLELLDAPNLYEAYPHLKNIDVVLDKDIPYFGSYSLDNKQLTLNPDKLPTEAAMQDVITHEIDHAIQDHEGFTGGSNPMYEERKAIESVYNKLQEVKTSDSNDPRVTELRNLYKDMVSPFGKYNSPFKQSSNIGEYMYSRQPGEINANLSMARRLLTDEQRRSMSPQQMQKWLTDTNTRDAISGRQYRQPFYYPE